jgi:hypothetical protein
MHHMCRGTAPGIKKERELAEVRVVSWDGSLFWNALALQVFLKCP